MNEQIEQPNVEDDYDAVIILDREYPVCVVCGHDVWPQSGTQVDGGAWVHDEECHLEYVKKNRGDDDE